MVVCLGTKEMNSEMLASMIPSLFNAIFLNKKYFTVLDHTPHNVKGSKMPHRWYFFPGTSVIGMKEVWEGIGCKTQY